MASKEKIVFEIEIDSGKSENTLGGLEDRIEKLRELQKGEQIGSKAFNDLSKDIQTAESAVKNVELAFESLDIEQQLTAGMDAVTGITGGFVAAQGAMALMGTESEALEEALVKVAGAMALSQGLRDLGNGAIALKKMGGLTGALTKAQKGLNAAVKANPYTALAVVIAAIAASVYLLVKRSNDYADSVNVTIQRTKALAKATDTATNSIQGQVTKVDSLVSVLKDENATLEQKEEAVKQLNELSPQYLGDLTVQNALTEKGTKLINDYNTALKARALTQALEESLVELMKEKIDLQKEEVGWFDSMLTNGIETTKMFGNLLTGQESLSNALDNNVKKQKKRNDGILADNLAAHDTKIEATTKELAAAQKTTLALDGETRAYEHNVVASQNRTKAKKEYEKLTKIDTEDPNTSFREIQMEIVGGLQTEIDKRKELANVVEETEFQKLLRIEESSEEATRLLKEAGAAAAEEREDKLKNAQIALNTVSAANELFQSAELDRIKAKQDAGEALTAAEIKTQAQATKRKKILAVAQIAIDTARGISAAVAAGAGLIFPANIPAILMGVTAVLAGVSAARKALGTADSSISAASVTSAATGGQGAQVNNISNTASLVDQDQQNVSRPVLVVESFNEVSGGLETIVAGATI